MKRNKTTLIKRIFSTGSVLMVLLIFTVIAGIYLPNTILKYRTNKIENTVSTAPTSYYSSYSTATAKEASDNLSSLDRMKLVSGSWESSCELISKYDSELSVIDAVNLAKNSVNKLYLTGLYPITLTSGYENWYSWTSEVYKYTDTTFNTYSTNLWHFTFTLYDESKINELLMTEDGTILEIKLNSKYVLSDNMTNLLNTFNTRSLLNYDLQSINLSYTDELDVEELYTYIDHSDVILSQKYIATIVMSSGDSEDFYIYNYNGNEAYGIGIIPVN